MVAEEDPASWAKVGVEKEAWAWEYQAVAEEGAWDIWVVAPAPVQVAEWVALVVAVAEACVVLVGAAVEAPA